MAADEVVFSGQVIGAVSSPSRLPLDLNAAFQPLTKIGANKQKEAMHEHDSKLQLLLQLPAASFTAFSKLLTVYI
jgi:hypothetical protein